MAFGISFDPSSYGSWGGSYDSSSFGSTSGWDWGSLVGSGSDSGGGGWLNTLGNLFGGSGGGSSDSGGGTNWMGAILSGLGSAADSYMTKENNKDAAAESGKQSRLTLGYGSALKDYYGQLDKKRKRTALDTYGQFSLMGRYAPNYQRGPDVQVPPMPSAG